MWPAATPYTGCAVANLRSLLELYYSGRQSQQSFLLSPSTHSLHVSASAGHLQVNIFLRSYLLPFNGSVIYAIFIYFYHLL
jgi:hypothetical protein